LPRRAGNWDITGSRRAKPSEATPQTDEHVACTPRCKTAAVHGSIEPRVATHGLGAGAGLVCDPAERVHIQPRVRATLCLWNAVYANGVDHDVAFHDGLA
jgi:hypothetical protein